LLIWDGLGFFGFDDTKLARLKGVPVTFLSKFSSFRWIILSASSFVFTVAILILEGKNLGNLKDRQIFLENKEQYHYDI
jgi:hypothetical protein